MQSTLRVIDVISKFADEEAEQKALFIRLERKNEWMASLAATRRPFISLAPISQPLIQESTRPQTTSSTSESCWPQPFEHLKRGRAGVQAERSQTEAEERTVDY